MKHASRILLTLAMLGLTACTATRSLQLRTSPPGAKIYLNGLEQGTSPRKITFDFSKADYNVIQLVSPGHEVNWNVYTREDLPDTDYMTISLTK